MSKRQQILRASAATAALLAAHGPAFAAEAAAAPAASPDIVVTADRTGLLERRSRATVLGINKPLIETPRSASFVSATTLERYGILTIDRLTAVSPSTYTASFYGVPGSVEIRGTLAENYFRGFKRIEDRGTYPTPIGDAAEIDVVRGPPTPIFGPGKVGGLLNFTPKSAHDDGAYITQPTGEVTATVGSYDKKNLTGQVGLPVALGTAQGGVYAYGELEDSHSYYDGIHPRHQLVELSSDFDLGHGWSIAFGGMGYTSQGDVQTPGWNRITQSLIDNQTYITGRNTGLTGAVVGGRLVAGLVEPGYPFGASPINTGYFGFTPTLNGDYGLSNVGTTKLSPHTVYIAPGDFSRTGTATYYFDLAKDLGDGQTLKLQLFDDNLSNKRFVSYGFPADYHAWTTEARLSYLFHLDALDGLITTQNVVGASDRYYKGEQKESYDSGLIALDRRDLSAGPSPTDVLDSPFENDPNGMGFETDIQSHWNDYGVFATSDITVAKKLDIILGGRFDNYDVYGHDVGLLATYDYANSTFTASPPVHGGKGKWTYSASATYKLPLGLMPYITYAQDAALEVAQAGDLSPGQIASGGWLSGSQLTEGGVKFQLLNKTIVGSVDAYRQSRSQLAGLNNISQRSVSRGVEYEIRYLATNNISFTLAGDTQRTEIIGPDTSTVYLPVYTVGYGLNPAAAYGGAFLTYDFAAAGGHPGNYENTLIPHSVVSLFGAYTSDKHDWGRAGATLGATYVSKTSVLVSNGVTYPDYTVVNASAFFQRGGYEVTLNVDNLFDKLYFTPNQDPTYANVSVIPSVGHEWRVTLKRKF